MGYPGYHKRFGFQHVPGLVLEGVPEEVFFAPSFDDHVPQGVVEFQQAFKADGPQEGAGDAPSAPT